VERSSFVLKTMKKYGKLVVKNVGCSKKYRNKESLLYVRLELHLTVFDSTPQNHCLSNFLWKFLELFLFVRILGP